MMPSKGPFDVKRCGCDHLAFPEHSVDSLNRFVDSIFGTYSGSEAKLGRVQDIVFCTKFIDEMFNTLFENFSQIGEQGNWPVTIWGLLILS